MKINKNYSGPVDYKVTKCDLCQTEFKGDAGCCQSTRKEINQGYCNQHKRLPQWYRIKE